MLTIGLAGGIASGKSMVVRAWERQPGVVVVDADRIAWDSYCPGTETYKHLIDRFGRRILGSDGQIDRAALGKIVFSNRQALQDLNRIVHPAVRKRIVDLINEHRQMGTEVLVIEVALILDSDESAAFARQHFDRVVAPRVDPEEQVRRLMARDGIDRKEALHRIDQQIPQEERLARADDVIDTSGDPEDTIARAERLLERLRIEFTN
ncbi:MAG: dephospho-CoA kinase [Candidatus Bipolaricaulia bacterium]